MAYKCSFINLFNNIKKKKKKSDVKTQICKKW